jgi:hypothetical protein
MVEFNIHSILRAQKGRPPDTPVDASYFWEAWILLCIWAWGMGYSYGEVLVKWWIK